MGTPLGMPMTSHPCAILSQVDDGRRRLLWLEGVGRRLSGRQEHSAMRSESVMRASEGH